MILGHSWGRKRSFELSNLFFVVVEGAVHLQFPRDLVLHHCQSHTEVLQGRHSRHKAITHALLTTHSKILLQLATKIQAGLVLNLTCGHKRVSMFTSLSATLLSVAHRWSSMLGCGGCLWWFSLLERWEKAQARKIWCKNCLKNRKRFSYMSLLAELAPQDHNVA